MRVAITGGTGFVGRHLARLGSRFAAQSSHTSWESLWRYPASKHLFIDKEL